MRLIDWLSMLLTGRWRIRGAEAKRLREFISNFDNDFIDCLDV